MVDANAHKTLPDGVGDPAGRKNCGLGELTPRGAKTMFPNYPKPWSKRDAPTFIPVSKINRNFQRMKTLHRKVVAHKKR